MCRHFVFSFKMLQAYFLISLLYYGLNYFVFLGHTRYYIVRYLHTNILLILLCFIIKCSIIWTWTELVGNVGTSVVFS